MRVLHLISDVSYFIVYYIIGYRRKTVQENLKLAFPEKSETEIKLIAKKSYKHFTDIFVEMIKSFTISKKELSKRFKATNIEVLKKFEAKNKSIIVYGAHYANWEWIFILNSQIKFNGYAIYKKLSNKYFEKKIKNVRSRYNTELVPTKEVFALAAKNENNNILSLYGFLGDQTPKIEKAHYWSNFLNVYVPIQTGIEFFSKKHNIPVIFFSSKRIKRSYYECTFKVLADNPKEYKDYEITDLYLREVEKQITDAPEYYFWTHKRFKHKDKAPKN